MAKSIPGCSPSSCFGLSLSSLGPFIPIRSVSTRSIRSEYSLDSSSRNLPRISITCHPPRLSLFRCCCCFTSSGSATEPEDSLTATVFIKGLPQSTGEGDLKRAFSEFGDVASVKIFLEKETMQPLGSAFVWFANKESAELAVKEMDGKFFEGRFISVSMAKQRRLNKRRQSAAPFKF